MSHLYICLLAFSIEKIEQMGTMRQYNDNFSSWMGIRYIFCILAATVYATHSTAVYIFTIYTWWLLYILMYFSLFLITHIANYRDTQCFGCLCRYCIIIFYLYAYMYRFYHLPMCHRYRCMLSKMCLNINS